MTCNVNLFWFCSNTTLLRIILFTKSVIMSRQDLKFQPYSMKYYANDYWGKESHPLWGWECCVRVSACLQVNIFVYVCTPGPKCGRKRWRMVSAFLRLHQYGMLLLQWKLSIYADWKQSPVLKWVSNPEAFQKWFLKTHSPFISAISNRKSGWTLDLCHCCYVYVPVHKDVGVFECTLFEMGKHFARLTDTWNSLKVRRSGVCSVSSCVIPMP